VPYYRPRNPRVHAFQFDTTTENFDAISEWCDVQWVDVVTVEVRHYIGGDPGASGDRGAYTTLNYLDWVTVYDYYPTATAGDTEVISYFDFPYRFAVDETALWDLEPDAVTPPESYEFGSVDEFVLGEQGTKT
jgi:hypothetical protein